MPKDLWQKARLRDIANRVRHEHATNTPEFWETAASELHKLFTRFPQRTSLLNRNTKAANSPLKKPQNKVTSHSPTQNLAEPRRKQSESLIHFTLRTALRQGTHERLNNQFTQASDTFSACYKAVHDILDEGADIDKRDKILIAAILDNHAIVFDKLGRNTLSTIARNQALSLRSQLNKTTNNPPTLPNHPVNPSDQSKSLTLIVHLKSSILRLESSVAASFFEAEWKHRHPKWLEILLQAKDISALANALIVFEDHTAWNAFGDTWHDMRDKWIAQCRHAKSAYDIAEALICLEDELSTIAFNCDWMQERVSWGWTLRPCYQP